jgi:hypothetical protein
MVLFNKLKKNIIESEISYPKLIITESSLVIEPNLDNEDYWLFDTVWEYGSGQNNIGLYSSISGYGNTINNKKTYGIITIRESMSPNNVEIFLSKKKIREICDKTKLFFINIMKNHNIDVNLDDNILYKTRIPHSK